MDPLDSSRVPQPEKLDRIDRQILAILSKDAKITNAKLAEELGIAQSTCINRVRSLVERKVISKFTVEVTPGQLGLTLQALISINIRPGARQHISEFRDEIRRQPEVVQLFFLGGVEDFLIHVATRDTNHLREFVLENLSEHPVVASTRTSIVFSHDNAGFRFGQ